MGHRITLTCYRRSACRSGVRRRPNPIGWGCSDPEIALRDRTGTGHFAVLPRRCLQSPNLPNVRRFPILRKPRRRLLHVFMPSPPLVRQDARDVPVCDGRPSRMQMYGTDCALYLDVCGLCRPVDRRYGAFGTALCRCAARCHWLLVLAFHLLTMAREGWPRASNEAVVRALAPVHKTARFLTVRVP